ncbi:MAG TPA: hypothetical protein DCZ69_06965 [Syntrophobacteraceae bacterium]|nr:hypothetical protein [Syntrophobacteraceae bacterium]HBZ55676.1 hypothetical protein [Syntrophobacteraceae bacterium]
MSFFVRKFRQSNGKTWLNRAAMAPRHPSEIRRIARGYENRSLRRMVQQALASPYFPWFFLVRNLQNLTSEPRWRRLPIRLREVASMRLLLERSRFFLELAAWRRHQPAVLETSASFRLTHEEALGYCDHCGACCEIASGRAQFPAVTPFPARWQGLFAAGLGRWHRFCPFLWERPPGGSLCAIHPWRPLACRVFEKEECDYLKKGLIP